MAITTAAITCCSASTSLAASPAPAEEAFKIIAEKKVSGLSDLTTLEKKAQVLHICEHLSSSTDPLGAITSVETIPSELDGVAYEAVLNFPFTDMNMDGVADSASCNVEFWHEMNDDILSMSDNPRYMSAMPWPMAVYTEGDNIKIALRLPETTMRVFFNDSDDKATYEEMGAVIRADIENFVISTLQDGGDQGFKIEDELVKGTQIKEEVLQGIESMIGPINSDSVAPMVSISAASVPASMIPEGSTALDAVVGALEVAINTPRVGDLNQDSVVDAADKAVLPGMFQQVMTGEMSVEQMQQVMATAPYVWNMGGTFQQWKSVKLMQSESTPGLYELSVCQPFYAQTALQASGSLFHQTIMPCRLLVWDDGVNINIAITNPEVFFAAFWLDAPIEAGSPMAELFKIFPTFVLNEMITMVNGALGDQLQVETRMALH
ncbi:MAG: hypothetical protein ABFS09_09115 [Thermodesulfobacteriota bacterium]